MRLFQLLQQFKFLRTPTNSDGPSKGGPLILDIPMEGIRYMKLKAIAVMALMAFGLCMPVKAQVASTVPASIAGSVSMPAGMVHDITPFGQIDGKQNPDQITNDVAFRLLMNDLFSRDINGKNGVIFEGLLNKIDLAPPDSNTLRTVVIAYNKNFDALVSANNNTAGGSLTFWRDVYALVYNTRLGLSLQLSDDGNETFDNYLQIHKQYLSVSPSSSIVK
jgi:hypothetical protein